MKRLSLLFALSTAPHFAFAQPAKPPVAAPKTGQLPEAQDLLDHIFDVYEGAKTFRGSFDIEAQSREDTKARMVLAYAFKLQTLVRYNDAGDLNGEVSRVEYQTPDDGTPDQTLRLLDDGKSAHIVFEQQHAFQDAVHPSPPMMRQIVQPVLETIVDAMRQFGAKPKVSHGKDAGIATFVIRSKADDGTVRVVLDAQTRALRSIELQGDLASITIRGTNQVFDAPVADAEFAWKPAPELRQVQPGEIPLPQALRAAQVPKPEPAN